MLAARRTLVLLLVLAAARVGAQPADLSFVTTRAEATDYVETSRYDDVRAILDVLTATSPDLYQTTFGYSVEGRPLPLAVWGAVDGASPESVRAADGLRVFIMANIHAGEVAGKEAALVLLRSLAGGLHAAWADSLTLLVAPIYNADGNERVSLYHRPRQHGPFGGMGQRPNAQGYDLNRDHTKLDSPEARALVGLLAAYDPHVVIDLHTTNGTVHGYHLTYAPPLHPNTPGPLVDALRDAWLPAVTDRVRAEHGWAMYHYGNLPRPGSDRPHGWYTFDHRPRFSNNYAGLRNRLGILSEAYAYAPFEERVLATLRFVEAVLDYAHAHAGALRAIVAAADSASVVGSPLALRASVAPFERPAPIELGAADTIRHPYTGEPVLARADTAWVEAMPEYGRFEPTEVAVAPAAYYVPPDQADVLDRLGVHGVQMDALAEPQALSVEAFALDSVDVAGKPYQQRHLRELHGRYRGEERTLPAGTVRVPLDQPLGRLVFTLLEPRSDDGFATWGVVELEGADADEYPIVREPAGE